jgi:hypothetical protein
MGRGFIIGRRSTGSGLLSSSHDDGKEKAGREIDVDCSERMKNSIESAQTEPDDFHQRRIRRGWKSFETVPDPRRSRGFRRYKYALGKPERGL